MTLRQLEVFVAVARERSFSRAARKIHLSQPTLSEHIRELEQGLGVYVLPRIIAAFRQRYPGIDVGLKIANSRLIEEGVRANDFDLGVVGGHGLAPGRGGPDGRSGGRAGVDRSSRPPLGPPA
jgi:DNA-binding transcriptional LysR family regulator